MVATIYLLFMIFIRATGLLMLMPVFSGQNIPVLMRVALGAMLAWLFSAFVHANAVPNDVFGIILSGAHELVLGLLMGLAVRILFFAVEFAGQIMATEMGLVMSANLDPITRTSSTAVSTSLFYFACILFLVTNSHHAVFAAFLRSFEIAPIGGHSFDRGMAELLVETTGKLFLIAVQMAAPVMAVNFVVTFTFAILGKSAPSIGVFNESFGIRIIAGLVVMSLTLGLTAQLVLSYLRQTPELMLRMLP